MSGKRPSLLSSRLDSLSNPKRKKRSELVFCPHCDQQITVKTYNRHRRLFYNRDKNAWRTRRVSDESTSSETEREEGTYNNIGIYGSVLLCESANGRNVHSTI